MKAELREALAPTGVVSRKGRPDLIGAIDVARRRGELTSVLPGVYAEPSRAGELLVRARAARLRDPNCVVIKDAAAALMGWEHVPTPRDLQVASLRLRSRPGLIVERRSVPRHLTRTIDGVRTTSRALTALELTPDHGTAVVDDAMRRGVRLIELQSALAMRKGSRGQRGRRLIVDDSRDRPFSPAERAAHRALREASGLPRWQGNVEFRDGQERLIAVGDIVFDSLLLVLEIDGRGHRDPQQAARDRRKDLWLSLRGWQVVRLDAVLTQDAKDFLRTVRQVIAARRGVLRRVRPGRRLGKAA